MSFLQRWHIALAAIACLAIGLQVHAQFSWDADCGFNWADCCNFGTEENPEYHNNWTIAPSFTTCPNLPGSEDDVYASTTVILAQPYLTHVKSLSVTGTFMLLSELKITDDLTISGNIGEPTNFLLQNGPVATIQLQSPDSIATISSFATVDFQFDGGIWGSSKGQLINNGLIMKSVGFGGISALNIPVENNNTIRSLHGILEFQQSCTNNGLIEAISEGEIRFQGVNLLDGEVRGDGLVRFVSTTTEITGDYHPTNTLVAGGATTVNFDVDTSLENLTFGNPCTIGGSGDLTIDDLTWNGGYSTFAPGGTTIIEDTLLIQHDTFAGGHFTINRDMELHGDSVIDTNAQLHINDGELRNYGELQIRGGANILQGCCAPPSVIQNIGTLRKVSGAPSLINVPFFNIGEVAVESGSLELGEMQNDADIIVNTGATLLLAHPQQINLDLGSITGPGAVKFINDQFNPQVIDAIAGVYDVGITTITGAQVEFLNDAATETLNLNYPSSKLLGDGDLVVTGQLNWGAGEMAGAGATIVHGPMVLYNTSYSMNLNRLLELNVTAEPGKTLPNWTMNIHPLGTLHCKSITIDGHVYNNGVISLGTPTFPVAQLHLTGGYTQAAGGILSISKLGPVHDKLNIDGAANLSGTLNATGFPTTGGAAFTILSAASVAGTFTVANLPEGVQVMYTDTSVILQAPGTPCPADIAPIGLGDGVVDVDDLLVIINAWGLCDPKVDCQADIAPSDGNGVVDVDDLLAVINAWGECPD